MKIYAKIWVVTTDGDNMGIEATVYASEQEARDDVTAALRQAGVARCADGQPIESGSLSELSEAWEAAFDGMCSFEEYELGIKHDPETDETVTVTVS